MLMCVGGRVYACVRVWDSMLEQKDVVKEFFLFCARLSTSLEFKMYRGSK